MLVLIFSSKLGWGSYIIPIAKSASKKIATLILSLRSFVFLRLLRISLNLLYAHARNLLSRLDWCS